MPATPLCPKCGRHVGLVSSDVATVGALLLHDYHDCQAVLLVTKSGPSPVEFELRLSTEAERASRQDVWQHPDPQHCRASVECTRHQLLCDCRCKGCVAAKNRRERN